MMSKIEWTDRTWNPVTGCTKVSPGCKHCYAERMAARLKRMGVKGYHNGFNLMLHNSRLFDPYRWRKPSRIFVCSMSDLFHEDVPFEFIDRVMGVMARSQRHTYQVLTKRPERMYQYFLTRHVPGNAWLGASVESRRYTQPRIDYLNSIEGARVRFLSIEPLLEDLGKLYLGGIHWVIVGGESGPGARPMKVGWVENIHNQVMERHGMTQFFFKQWGAYGEDGIKRAKKANGRMFAGREWNEFPYDPLLEAGEYCLI